jgi:hypothetical protein
LLACACGDIDVQSIRSGAVVPSALAGEWQGVWQSELGGSFGVLTLRIQDFDGEPVVAVDIAHPCVPPDEYQFRATASTVELLADSVVLFRAVLGPERTLVGTYGCLADTGSWDATWQRDLPELVDLSGQWLGSVSVPGFPPETLVVQLEQSVRGGALALDGSLRLPNLSPEPLPLVGTVQFREGAFDLVLVSAPGSLPLVYLVGVGDTPTLRVQDGQLQAAIDPSTPLVVATWDVQWQTR